MTKLNPKHVDATLGDKPTTFSTRVALSGDHLTSQVLGTRDEWLDDIERSFPDHEILVRGNEITVTGPESQRVASVFEELALLIEGGTKLDEDVLRRILQMVEANLRPSEVLGTDVVRLARGGSVRPKTAGQRRYIDAIASNIITFGLGPAGTGKSWLAVAMAAQALQKKQVDRIVLTRPAVEAGERLGFLPGDLMAKVDPYLRPLYDALYDMVGAEGAVKLIERGAVEVAPLAFMRGRTLNRSFIILDEAQNTTPEQMKMFLTRIGFGSKAVITGDTSQVDVAGGRSGLAHLEEVLADIEGLGFVRLGSRDVVRHRIVAEIVDAYDRAESSTEPRAEARQSSTSEHRAPATRPKQDSN